ncbi:MAG: nucleotide exchange factor GrpE [Acholeplasma sp.]
MAEKEKETVHVDETESTETKASKKEKKSKQQLKIESLEAEIKSLNDKYLRTLAEAENFKKRIQAEKVTDRKYAASGFATELLTPYEQFSKIVEFPTDNELLSNFLIGFKMIRDQFKDVLEKEGVVQIKSEGQMFDAKVHHAIEKESNKEKPNGTILEVLQNGYYFKDRVLRPAMVKINEWSEENGEDK